MDAPRTNTLAELLRARMAEEKDSQARVADACGVRQVSVSRWLAGRMPAEENLGAIARYLGESVATVAALVDAQRRALGEDMAARVRRPTVRELDAALTNLEQQQGTLERQQDAIAELVVILAAALDRLPAPALDDEARARVEHIARQLRDAFVHDDPASGHVLLDFGRPRRKARRR